MSNIVKVTVFLTDMNDFSIINQVYANYFTDPFPARVAVEVSKLPLDASIEIEAMAFLN